MTRCLLALFMPAACLLGALPSADSRAWAADAPATAPRAAEGTSSIPHDMALLVAQLGDDDPQVRDAATNRLSAMGRAALPALRAGAASDDPEVAGRARRLMTGARYRIGPETPAEAMELVKQYRSEDPMQRQRAIQQLGNMGGEGYRVLAKLRRNETDPAWRELLTAPLRAGAQLPVNLARELIQAGSEDEAESLLADAASGGEGMVSRSYAALLLSRGRLDETIRDLVTDVGEAPDSDDAFLLACLSRAKGDTDAVLRYASRIAPQPGFPWGAADALKREAWFDRHDWPKLIEMVEAKLREVGNNGIGPRLPQPNINAPFARNGGVNPAIRRALLAEKAAYARLGGRAAEFEDAVADIRHEVEQAPTMASPYAGLLLLNERYADGLNAAISGKDYVTAFHLLSAQGRHEDALRQVDAARAEGWQGLPVLELVAAQNLASIGEKEQAEQIVDRAVKSLEPANAAAADPELIRAELALGRNDKAFERVAAALQSPANHNHPAAAMALLLPRFPEPALRWRAFLTERQPGAPATDVLTKVWALFSRKLPAKEAEALLRDATENAAGIRVAAIRDPWFEAIADAARAAGREDLADSVFERMASVSDGWFPWKYLGDRAARKQDWPRAVECYAKAKQKDPAEPTCLWLHGWARRQVKRDDPAAGKDEMSRADELLLGDETRWAGFAQAIVEAGADSTGDAEPQRELLRRLTDPSAWANNESYHASARALLTAGKRGFEVEDPLEEQADEQPGEQADAGGVAPATGRAVADRYLRAADLMSRWLIPMSSGHMFFRQPGAYLGEPAAVHITRARGLIEQEDIAAAMKEADLALAALPANTQLPIDLVPALDRHGHKAEAEALFRKVAAAADVSIARHPQCAELHNGMAWMCAKCGRDLDKALKNAEQATTLSPDAVAYLDTLAEVHFRRGEREAAIGVMRKCIEIDPHFEYLQRQLKRFTSAAAAGGPSTAPGK